MVAILALLTTLAGATVLSSTDSRTKRSIPDGKFEARLQKANSLLRSERDADNTMKLIRKLHSMEDEIREELEMTPEEKADLEKKMKNYGHIRRDHVRKMGDSIAEINRNSGVDLTLFQGDMILTEQQAAEVLADIEENTGHRTKRQAFRDKSYPNTTWTNGVNYYFYNSSSAAVRVFRKAAALWATETCVNFGETYAAEDAIVVIESVGCWSHIGKIGGKQELSIGAGCETVGIAAHEIAHAMGFYHTQSRHDRDSFVKIDFSNLQYGWESQFTRQTEQTNYNYNITYDYGTIMHYGATSASANGQPFMIPHDITFLQTLGSPFISFYEKLMMNLHYKCLDKCPKESWKKCKNGGFPHPRNCNKCTCPSGYGGDYCDQRPQGCGRTVIATKSYQTINDTVGRWDYHPDGDVDEYYMCTYWIQGPPGSKIEVVFVNYTENLSVDGCEYAGVEIKTLADKRHTGYRFCSSDYFGATLISEHNIVPIITYSRVHQANAIIDYRIAETTETPETTNTSTETTNLPPSGSECEDNSVCEKLSNFCEDYDDDEDLKRSLCPKKCGVC